jgi:pyruvate formate lyase activating enzyme
MAQTGPPSIRGIQENTLLDWEGRLAAIVFLSGCNFRCPYCHSRHLILNPDVLGVIPLDAVDEMIKRHSGWLDGIVISGGEPTLSSGLPDLIRHFRALGAPVKLNTNGSRPDVISDLLAEGLLDAIARSIETIIASDIEYEFCTTVCPALLTEDDVIATALALRGAKRYVLQNFRPVNCLDPAYETQKPYDPDLMRSLAQRCQKYVQRCTVRGDAEQATERKPEQGRGG